MPFTQDMTSSISAACLFYLLTPTQKSVSSRKEPQTLRNRASFCTLVSTSKSLPLQLHIVHSTGYRSYPSPGIGLLVIPTWTLIQTTQRWQHCSTSLCLSVSVQIAGANTQNLPQEIDSSCLCCVKNKGDSLCNPI